MINLFGYGIPIEWINNNMFIAWVLAVAITFIIVVVVYRWIERTDESSYAGIVVVVSPFILMYSWMIIIEPVYVIFCSVLTAVIVKGFIFAVNFNVKKGK